MSDGILQMNSRIGFSKRSVLTATTNRSHDHLHSEGTQHVEEHFNAVNIGMRAFQLVK